MDRRKAGNALLDFLFSENGEEILESLTVGGLTGAGMLMTGSPIEQVLATAALAGSGAYAGNKLGKPAGAMLGKRIYDKEIPTNGDPMLQMIAGMGQPSMMDAMRTQAAGGQIPLTGESIGRLTGRIVGDEVGALGGIALAGLVGQQMGWESEKDRMIRQLEDKLAEAKS